MRLYESICGKIICKKMAFSLTNNSHLNAYIVEWGDWDNKYMDKTLVVYEVSAVMTIRSKAAIGHFILDAYAHGSEPGIYADPREQRNCVFIPCFDLLQAKKGRGTRCLEVGYPTVRSTSIHPFQIIDAALLPRRLSNFRVIRPS